MKDKKKELIKHAKESKVEEAKVESSEHEKKGLYIILGIFIILIVLAVVWLLTYKDSQISDAKKFEKEYESLNGEKYYEIDVDSNNPMVYSTSEEVIKMLENGTGVIYFGFPECPWCRNLVPNLITAAKEAGIAKIYYLNNKDERDIKKLDSDNNITIEREGTKNYYRILELLGNNASNYDGLNDSNIKRLYFPTVVFIKDGQIIDFHEGTLDSQIDPKVELTSEQKSELVNILREKMEKIITCNGAC